MRVSFSMRAALVAVVCACVGVFGGQSAHAQQAATVTLLHGIPGAVVDVAVDGKVVISNFEGGQTQDLSSSAGQTLIGLEVRSAGTTESVIGPTDFKVPATGNWTVIAHLDATGAPKLSVFENDTTPTNEGEGRLVVVHAAAAPEVDLVVGTERPIVGLANGKSQALTLPVGTISGAQLAPTGADPIVAVPTVDVVAGTDLIVYAVGSASNNSIVFYTQSIDVGTAATTTAATTTTTSTTVAVTTAAPTTVAPATTAPATSAAATTAPATTAAATTAPLSTQVAAGDATVTLLHGIPGLAVDVVVNGKVVFANFEGGQTQDLSAFSGTTLTQLEVRPAGDTTAAIGPVDVAVPKSGNWTVVAHLDADGKPTLSTFSNDTTKTASGQGRLTVVHAAAAPAVDLVVGTDRPIVNLANGATKSLALPAGSISGAKLAATGAEPSIDVPTVQLKAGSDLIVYAVGSLADNTLTFYTQTIDVGMSDATTSSTTQISSNLPKTGSGNTIWLFAIVVLIAGVLLTTVARRNLRTR